MSCFWKGILSRVPDNIKQQHNLTSNQTLFKWFKKQNCLTPDITCNKKTLSKKQLKEN